MTRRTGSLRRRVTLASLLLGACLSVVFGVGMIVVAESYESILVEEILRGQAEDYSRRMSTEAGVSLPRTRRLSGYLRRGDGTSDAPAALAALPPGIHEVGDDDVGVFDTASGRFYFVIDLSDIEALERLLAICLGLVLLGGTLMAGWLGWLTAGTTIAPVTRLSSAVDGLPIEPQLTGFGAAAGDDELGRLALAIDRYQQRLVDADEAERRFFADASHELRTPVAVVRGAVELLAEDAHDAGAKRRVARLERGVDELTDLIDMLFGLVRRREVDAMADAAQVIAVVAAAWPPRSIDVEIDGCPSLPRRETGLLLRAIIRRLMVPESGNGLTILAAKDGLRIACRVHGTDHGETSATVTRSDRSDRSLGLTLASRLAEQLGWRIEASTHQVDIRW